jgi:hypothetical protein
MKTKVSSLLIIFFYFLVSQKLIAQTSEFSRGFQEGFKKGYCYNKNFMCNPPLAPMTPLPRLNESDNSYTDGYNRGFQVGLDMQRVDGTYSSNTNSVNYPQYRFNEYIPTISVNDYANVLLYKRALFNKRLDWIRKRIEDLHDLNYALSYKNYIEAYNARNTEITKFVREQLQAKNPDLSDNYVFNQIVTAFSTIQKNIYNDYSYYKTNVSLRPTTSCWSKSFAVDYFPE